jgi:imidazolonepropionase-like amidohydrolase
MHELKRICSAALVFAGCLGAAPFALAAPILIENVHVITMQSDETPRAGAVLVEEGRIAAVGPLAAIDVPTEVQRIDGRGGYLIPGLTDMHAHIDTPESLKLHLAYGVTTIRNMWGTDEILAMQREEAGGSLLAPDIVTVSPIIDGEPPFHEGSVVLKGPEEVDELVSELERKGYSALKTYELIDRESYVALAQAANERGMTLEGHVPQAVGAFDAVLLGHDTLEHSMRIDAAIVSPAFPYPDVFRPRELVDLVARIHAGELGYEEIFRRDMLRALAGLMTENDAALVPTLGVYEILSYSAEDREAMAKHELVDFINPIYKKYWLEEIPAPEGEMPGRGPELSDAEIASLDEFASLEHGRWVGIMHDEGVLVMAGTDAPNPGMFHGYSLHDELAHMVEWAGLSIYDALQTATANPASYWDIEGQRGVVAPGAEADLILLEANPLDDIASTRTILGVMADGQWLDRARLDGLRKEVRDAYASMARELEAGQAQSSGFPVHLHGRH